MTFYQTYNTLFFSKLQLFSIALSLEFHHLAQPHETVDSTHIIAGEHLFWGKVRGNKRRL